MLQAFLDQTNINDEEADKRDEIIAKASEEQYAKAVQRLARVGEIFIEKSQTTERTETSQTHEQFKNYDHSLETDRTSECDIKSGKRKMSEFPDMRPVERNGRIEYESNLTIDDLLDRT